MFQTGLFNFLKTLAPLTALLGTPRRDNSSGIWPVLAINEPVMPYVVFQQITNRPVMSMQGMNRLQMASYRFSCYAIDYEGAQAIAEVLRTTFATYTGTWTDGTIVQHIQLENAMDDTESIPHGTIYACHLDFEFVYVDMT